MTRSSIAQCHKRWSTWSIERIYFALKPAWANLSLGSSPGYTVVSRREREREREGVGGGGGGRNEQESQWHGREESEFSEVLSEELAIAD